MTIRARAFDADPFQLILTVCLVRSRVSIEVGSLSFPRSRPAHTATVPDRVVGLNDEMSAGRSEKTSYAGWLLPQWSLTISSL